MKKLFLFTFIAISLNAQQLIIDSKNFEANDLKGISIFTGNVKLKQGKDRLNSDKLEIYLTKKSAKSKREVLKYIAIGNVSFKLFSNGKAYEGKGDKLIYNIKQSQYSVFGNAYLKEKVEDKTLYGETIIINQKSGEAKVSGTEDKPVRFIINIEEKTEDKKEVNIKKEDKK